MTFFRLLLTQQNSFEQQLHSRCFFVKYQKFKVNLMTLSLWSCAFLFTIGTVGFPRPRLSTDALKLFIVDSNTPELQCPQTEPLKNIVCFQSGL